MGRRVLTIRGCTSNPDIDGTYVATHLTSTTVTIQTYRAAGDPPLRLLRLWEDIVESSGGSGTSRKGLRVCKGDKMTIAWHHAGALMDGLLAPGDNVKIRFRSSPASTDSDNDADEQGARSTPPRYNYATRQVHRVWGSGLSVTQFSVLGPFDDALGDQLEDVVVWADDTGTTEDVECSRRGLCDHESGICDCFAGYTGEACQVQNAVDS